MSLEIDAREIKRLRGKLRGVKRSAYPVAIRQALNDTATEARKVWVEEFKQQTITRARTFPSSQIRRDFVQTWDIDKMQSGVGSIHQAFDVLEHGGTERSKKAGAETVAIPRPPAAGGASRARLRERKVRPRLRLEATVPNAQQWIKSGSEKRSFAATLSAARRSGRSLAFLRWKDRQYLAELRGPKPGRKAFKSVRYLYDLTERTTETRARPSLQPAVEEASRKTIGFVKRSLEKQFAKLRFQGRL